MPGQLSATALRLIGLGAILAAVSEVWFYPVALDAHVFWLCAFYAPLAYTAWLALAHTRVRTWAGAFWGACLFGFFVEGIPVAVLYEAIPFSIFWTSISWHAIISTALGLWLFRRVAARGSVVVQIAAFAVAGVYLGAWSVELWSLQTDGSPWVWTPTTDIAWQMLSGWVLFVGGHIAFDLASRFTAVPARWELPMFGALTGLAFGAGMLIAAFPVSLILPVLAALAVWMMHRDGQGGATAAAPFLVRLSALRVPMTAYVLSLIVPVAAIATYSELAAADVQLESSAFHILWAGPVSLTLLVWSAARILTGR